MTSLDELLLDGEQVKFTATYMTVWWDELCDECGNVVESSSEGMVCPECGDEIGFAYSSANDYNEESGWTDPDNPFGGFKTSDCQEIVFDELGDAVEFMLDWPGSIWFLGVGSEASQDFRTGKATEVTLHVNEEVLGAETLNVLGYVYFLLQAKADEGLRRLAGLTS